MKHSGEPGERLRLSTVKQVTESLKRGQMMPLLSVQPRHSGDPSTWESPGLWDNHHRQAGVAWNRPEPVRSAAGGMDGTAGEVELPKVLLAQSITRD